MLILFYLAVILVLSGNFELSLVHMVLSSKSERELVKKWMLAWGPGSLGGGRRF